MVGAGLSERPVLAVARMIASALRYEPKPDHNVDCASRSLCWRTGTDATALA